MLAKIKAHWPVLGLLFVSILLCIANYTPGTWLSGWDTLHPEFNFGLSFERAFYGVFRIEQGLGAVAGHSHMADLPRIIILYIFHFVIPTDFLRYFYVFLNVIIGTLGMYFFLEKHVLKQRLASFLGALFYLLNVGTMQIFNVPFEMFTTLFATIPFLFYFATSFLTEKEQKNKYLLLFALTALLNTPTAYAATLWYVFFAAFSIYFFVFSLVNFESKRKGIKNFLILASTFIAVNLFWIFPNLYFVINHGKEVADANINLLFSDQAFLKNKEFGNIKDLLLIKEFYFDWNIYGGANKFIDLLAPYIGYLKNAPVLALAFVFGLSFVAGLVLFVKKMRVKSLPIISLLAFSLLFLVNDNFPVSFIYNFFQNHVPFFKEAFRFPDDKIFNVYVFLVSIFFGYFCLFVLEKLKKLNAKFPLHSDVREAVFALFVVILIGFYAIPSFSGNFINKFMRVEIPKYYFDAFSYLNTQSQTARVANLPIHSPWGWVYYNWQVQKPSYQGAGFLYFGIKQPLLDRDFDRWSPYNESYYREMSYAIYKKDSNLLKNVIKKYKIGFIFIDKSVFEPSNPLNILFLDESRKEIEQTGLVADKKTFGKITIFKLKTDTKIAKSLSTDINVNPKTTTLYEDFAYAKLGDYITTLSGTNLENVLFPFRDLIDNQSKLHQNILSLDNEKITLNPLAKVENLKTGELSDNLDLIPSDLIAERNGANLSLSFYLNTPVFDKTPSSSPIKASFNIVNPGRNLSISINQNQLFNIGVLPDTTPIALGKTLIQNGSNQISAFDASLTTPIKDVSKIIVPFFTPCDVGGDTERAGVSDNKIVLSGKGDLCLLIPYGFFPPNISGQNANILTDFQFRFGGNASITSCLFSQETSECLYYQDPLRNGNIASFLYTLSTDKASKRAIKIFFKTTNKDENKYLLTDFTSWYSKSIVDLDFSKSFLSNVFIKNPTVSFDKIYLSKNIIYDPGFAVSSLKKLQSDCPSPIINAKKELVSINGVSSAKYSSLNGSFCDHFSYRNLPHNQGYLVVVNSKNESGLPITLCVTDYTSRKCDVYSNLTPFKTFGKDVFLLPPMDKDGVGYDINIDNLGINKSPAVNYISNIEFIPIPYNFLLNIESSDKKPVSKLTGRVEEVIKYNPDTYYIRATDEPTLVTLNLSFEKGFRAYEISCYGGLSCFISTTLAPLFGKEIKTQVLVNNWENGWITPGGQIAIVFLPQYLEYFGIVLILGLLTYLLLRLKK